MEYSVLCLHTTPYYSLLQSTRYRDRETIPRMARLICQCTGCGGQMFHAELVPLLCTPAFRVRNATLHTWYNTEYFVLGQSILLIYIEDDSFLL